MSLAQLSLNGALITASSVAAVQGGSAIIRSKSPVPAKVQALATLTSHICFHTFFYMTDISTGARYPGALTVSAMIKFISIIYANEKIENRRGYDLLTEYMVTATAHVIMALFINVYLADTL